jgi:hypothetical protein
MKRSLQVMLLVCVAVAMVAATGLFAQGKQDFVLVNKTGLTVDKLFLSPADASHWGEDVLGRDTLDDGEKVTIHFSRKETDCKWDMKIVDEEKDEIVWEDLDLCKAEEITIKYEGKHPTAIIK